MQIIVRLSDEERTLELPEGADGFAVIDALGLFPDAVLVLRNDEVIPEDEPLSEGDALEIIKVGSRG
ncbi:MAG: MoaD/ThiS family protein [Thermoplasmata archaeon]|nr:MoaD/ThiS family protein [Thermoplasmata archaeon]